ncbi:Hypothetical protein Bdt_2841 [Bdellovibrio bacteriovorus str. Tiberius]|uniref:Uncharacterized protein n=2 Tax=Bdellovibrio bacteriovorus TaxID=959 RepID=K7YRM7_BDEBC|nr:Hypothetical protein Bdt_2841 [Bdellovibrio bacteriovorus str. Tiberius]
MIVAGLVVVGWLWCSPLQTGQEPKAAESTKSFAAESQVEEPETMTEFASFASESRPRHDHKHEPGHDCEESRRFAAEAAAGNDEGPMSSEEILQREMGTDWKEQFAVTEQDFVGTDGEPLDRAAFLREQDEQARQNATLPMDSLAAKAGR